MPDDSFTGPAHPDISLSSGPRTLRRGLRILDVLRRAGEAGLHVTEIALATGMQRSTVYRFLDVLVEEGYIVRDPSAPRYIIASVWSAERDPYPDLAHRLHPMLRRISDVTGDTAFLVRRSGSESLCIDREVGKQAVQVQAITIGHRQPLGVGAAGLALLAALPDAEALGLIEQNAARLRAYGNMTPERMRVLVGSTRARGWAVVGDAAVPGVVGVGMAVRDTHGYPLLAVSVSSPLVRLPWARQRKIAALLRRELAQNLPTKSG